MTSPNTFLRYIPVTGIYKTLYDFVDAYGAYMGEKGTHPWSQGFPRIDQLPGGPAMPETVSIPTDDLMYPKATGLPALRESIAHYYKTFYGADITADNVMVFAGGRPALIASLLFLDESVTVRIASTEYTHYYDMLERLGKKYKLVQSAPVNGFSPTPADYAGISIDGPSMMMLSNPCNPTGHTMHGDELAELVGMACNNDRLGLLSDEAYELFHDEPVSALQYVKDIDESNVIVIGAATKGLQAPGIRVGWVVASRKHIEILGNYSSFGLGGVSHPAQRMAVELLKPGRIDQVRHAIPAYYDSQRQKYGEAFSKLGLEVHTGNGSFYHWCRLTNGMTAEDLNQALFKVGAAIIKGPDCDMSRKGEESDLINYFRFSFGPQKPDAFDSDIKIMRQALKT